MKAFYNDPKQKGYNNDLKKADHVMRLFRGRMMFETYLTRYIKSRNEFETIINKTTALVNTFIGSEADDVPVKIKMTIQENISEFKKKVQEVEKYFNLEMQPELV